jgi:hypothetical protein
MLTCLVARSAYLGSARRGDARSRRFARHWACRRSVVEARRIG